MILKSYAVFYDKGDNMVEWKKVQFKDLYYKISEKNDLSFGKDKIISVANMYYNSNVKITDNEYLKTYNIFRVGDIAFEGHKNKDFSYGRFVENTIGDGIISHIFDVFRPLTDLNLLYWKYVINYENIMGRILKRCTKSATMMNNLVANDFLEEFISVPPIEEQQKIAEILSAQDKLIELKQKLIDNKKQQKKWLMQNLLKGKIRLKGFSGEWKKVKLSDTCKFLDNLRKPVKENERISGCYPYYGASGIIDYVDDYIFDGEYILLGEDGANIIMRSTSLAYKVKGKIWVNNHAHVLQLKSNYNIDFIVNVLENIHYDKYNSGTAQPKLNREVCENIILIIPLLAEQTAIGEILSVQDKEIELLEKELEQEKLRKKALMQFLLSDV